ncbi:translation initiation factor [Phycisphaera mikurensis]|uniref:Putative translation initiation factor n=1 Tax=Phycisphaera mikurensis (strain NBRC 102666 / KCTC 22515 / FYK2301M01) TaxID=1142394 RepID=I0II38_PHYMF|nr:translation initiation factor [Phycisphaera mikurensis]MBB6442511.1 translation initiation factor 1 [Phycisphaera mikurensis]BAM04926.1 putative translation initiation factor [Phycisphaera mikurensis NBRC 102666]
MGLFDGTPLERPVTCQACGLAIGGCACPRDASGAVLRHADQEPRVRRERRRGKWVTVVTRLDPDASDLAGLLKAAKASVSAGGGLRGDGFEVQGDHREALVSLLRERGFSGVKPAGG